MKTHVASRASMKHSNVSGKPKGNTSSATQTTKSFSILSEECDNENLLPKRFRKPTVKAAEALDKGVKAVAKGTFKRKKVDPKGAAHTHS